MRADDGWDRERFRELLTEIQKRAELTDADLADMAGRSRSQVNRWRIKAENRPDYEPLSRLSRELINRHPKVEDLARELLKATGYVRPAAPPSSDVLIDPEIELPVGFDPSSLPRAEVEIYALHDTPLNVRELLVQTRRLAMGAPVPGMQHMTKRDPDANGRGMSASN